MGLFSAVFGAKKAVDGAVADAKVEAAKNVKRDLVEAAIGLMVLVAYADGECEQSELEKMEQIISADDDFKHFHAEIGAMIDKFSGLMKAGMALGKMKVMREVQDIKNNAADAEMAFACACTMSMADGECEPEEYAILVEVGKVLGGFKPEAYGCMVKAA